MNDFIRDFNEVISKIWKRVPSTIRLPIIIIFIIVVGGGNLSNFLELFPYKNTNFNNEGDVTVSLGSNNENKSLTRDYEKESSETGEKTITVEVCREINNYWSKSTYIAKGEIAKCRIIYRNNGSYDENNVKVLCTLTNNIEINGDITLINAKHKYGITVDDNLENEGIDIGNYAPGEYAEISFSVKAIDSKIESEEVITASVSINGSSSQQSAGIKITNENGGWGDSSNGRRDYTIEQINSGELGNVVTFNSINNGKIGHEFNFVGARKLGDTGVWNADSIYVEDGQEYEIRLYVHNNNPKGTDAIAKDVKASFSLPIEISKEQTIIGYLDSSNAIPSRYWDGVTLKSDQYFYVEYIYGSATYVNNGIAKDGIELSDDIIFKGVPIGYNSLDGEIPGCYDYDGQAIIKVRVHYKKS